MHQGVPKQSQEQCLFSVVTLFDTDDATIESREHDSSTSDWLELAGTAHCSPRPLRGGDSVALVKNSMKYNHRETVSPNISFFS